VASEEDPSRRPWARSDWLRHADRLLDAARRYATPGGGRILFPGAEGGYGRDVDGLEGFARTLLLAGFRIAGDRGEGLDDLIAFVRRGIATGVDPDAPDRWVRMDEHGQAKVEAASIALVLDLTRPWVWDALDETTQQRVIAWLAPAVGDETYPGTNWVWFRIVVQTFLRSVGGPWSRADIEADLARHDSFQRADGWLSDGDERSYDHYVGWALHVYPALWPRMTGAADLAEGRSAGDVARLERYLDDALHLVGGDGSPLLQGRSLIYRFAAAAPFWAGVVAGVASPELGRLRAAAEAVVRHFGEHGAPDDSGVLTMGWHGEWRALAQSYSGPGSPYWAVKGFLGILLPADHPVWDAAALPLPVTEGDFLRAIAAPGWIVSGTVADGIVRVVNHGTDHALPGFAAADSPLYARMGYSTATSPLLDDRAWTDPLEQSVALVDDSGGATHRTGMELRDARVDGEVAVATAVWDAAWITPEPTAHRHGSGLAGAVTRGGRVRVDSVLRGAVEVRIIRVEGLAEGVDPDVLRLRVGGWPIAATRLDALVAGPHAEVASGALSSTVHALTAGSAVVAQRDDASPLGPRALVPFVDFDLTVGRAEIVVLELRGIGAPAATDITVEVDGDEVVVRWADGMRTACRLSHAPVPTIP
jgi:hypothetical protein